MNMAMKNDASSKVKNCDLMFFSNYTVSYYRLPQAFRVPTVGSKRG
jgi:hypothetical protein